jgi:hypothetical protein
MSYRPSSKPPETDWARHLDQVRKDHDWSATQLFKAVREELHLGPDSRSTFVADLHHDPKPHWKPGLVKLFGEPPPTPAPVVVEEPPSLAEALMALTEELRLSRESRADLERRLAALEPVVSRLARQALEASPMPPVPDGTKG